MPGVLAIDHGDKKTGLAAADALRIAVRPLEVVRHEGSEEALVARLSALLAELDVSTLVVGRPVHMDGSVGQRALAVQALAGRLALRFPALSVVLHDERLTTKEAEGLLRAEGYRGRELARRKDSWAALVLLRDWIASGEPAG
jgi:putative Holliday junction resolvase